MYLANTVGGEDFCAADLLHFYLRRGFLRDARYAHRWEYYSMMPSFPICHLKMRAWPLVVHFKQ